MAHDEIIYKKRLVRRRTWVIILTLWLFTALIPTVFDETGRNFILNFLVYGLVWGLPFLIWCLALLSINFFGTIAITPDNLRVGRREIKLSEIDALSLTRASGEPVDFITRIVRIGGELDLPIKLLSAENIGTYPIMGGAWGTPLASDSFILSLKSGQKYIVPTPLKSRNDVIESILKAVRIQRSSSNLV
jgi:hypothetical protein